MSEVGIFRNKTMNIICFKVRLQKAFSLNKLQNVFSSATAFSSVKL